MALYIEAESSASYVGWKSLVYLSLKKIGRERSIVIVSLIYHNASKLGRSY